MLRHFKITSCALLIFAGSINTASAGAGIGLPSMHGMGLGLLLFLALFVSAMLSVAFSIKENNNDSPTAGVLFIVVICYTGILGSTYFSSIKDFWFTGSFALVTSTIFLIFVASLLYYSIEKKHHRWIIPGTLAAFLILNLLTPSIVNPYYYAYIDNEPLTDGHETIKKMHALKYGEQYIKRATGEILAAKHNIIANYLTDEVDIENIDEKNFLVSFKGKSARLTRDEGRYYARNKNAFFHFPLFEIKIGNYKTYDLGTWRLVSEQEGNDINLYFSLREKPSNNGTCDTSKAKKLILNGANINYQPRGARSPPTAIEVAIYNNCTEIVELLIKNKVNVNYIDKRDDTTLLHKALSHYSSNANTSIKAFDTLKLLIDARVRVNYRNSDDDTALHMAAAYRYDITKLLIESGADINSENKDGDTPIDSFKKHFSFRGDETEGKLIMALLEDECKKDLRARDNAGL